MGFLNEIRSSYANSFESPFLAWSVGKSDTDVRGRVGAKCLPNCAHGKPMAGELLMRGMPFLITYKECRTPSHEALEQSVEGDGQALVASGNRDSLPELRVSVQTVTSISELGPLTTWQWVVAHLFKLVFELSQMQLQLKLTQAVNEGLQSRQKLTACRPLIAALRLQDSLDKEATEGSLEVAMGHLMVAADEYLGCRTLDSPDVVQRMKDDGYKLPGRTTGAGMVERFVESPAEASPFKTIEPAASHRLHDPAEISSQERDELTGSGSWTGLDAKDLMQLADARPIRLRDTAAGGREQLIFLHKGKVIVVDPRTCDPDADPEKINVVRENIRQELSAAEWGKRSAALATRPEIQFASDRLLAAVNNQLEYLMWAIERSTDECQKAKLLQTDRDNGITDYARHLQEDATGVSRAVTEALSKDNVAWEALARNRHVRGMLFDRIANDERLNGSLTPDKIAQLREQYIINHVRV